MSRVFQTILPAVILILSSCGQGKVKTASTPQTRPFPPGPAVPTMISDQGEKRNWTLMHFWDSFTDPSTLHHCDSTTVNGVRKSELDKAFLAYAGLLLQSPLPSSSGALANLFDRAEAFEAADTSSNVFEYFLSTVEDCLYGPNSLLRSEDLYLPFVRKAAASSFVAEERRETFEYDARMCSLNPSGSPAADFKFTLAGGKTMHLHDIEAEWTLLLFSNPGCKACESIYRAFTEDPSILRLQQTGLLAVANIYIDEELDKWLGYCASYPPHWYNGHDQDLIVRKDLLYSIRAIPSLYLLDSRKRVVMKDAPLERVMPFLADIVNAQNN